MSVGVTRNDESAGQATSQHCSQNMIDSYLWVNLLYIYAVCICCFNCLNFDACFTHPLKTTYYRLTYLSSTFHLVDQFSVLQPLNKLLYRLRKFLP